MFFSNYYRTLDTWRGDVRFIGMNTADGFRWCRNGLPGESELKRTYIIKGAAGTGKSTLMKNVADSFELKGADVVRFLCSSDPDSLDAVLIGGRVLILDGTAPHLKDADYPGALSELICLGNFWNRDKLISCSDEIVDLSRKKSGCFKKAYRFMSGMRFLYDEIIEDVSDFVDVQKMRKAMTRIVGKIKKAEAHPSVCENIIRSFGMRGAIKLPTLERKSDSVISVADHYGSSRLFFSVLAEELKNSGVSFIFSPDPLFSGHYSDIFVPNAGMLFSHDRTEKTEKILNMERFVKKDRIEKVRGEIRLAYKCWNSMREDAERELRKAAEYHFELERIYGLAMNFDAVSAYQKLLIKEIENRL